MPEPDHLETLLISVKESLEREIRSLGETLTTRFDDQAARLERHAALIQTGSRWTSRMNDWAEKIDRALDVKDKQIADLTRRVQDLEQRP